MKVHFISIGGSVMHQLAIALKHKGYHVTGSDDDIFEPSLTNLKIENLLPSTMGWNANNIQPGIDAIILGMHARGDNPELIRAKEFGLKIYSFPEYIYAESLNKIRVAIGGSHGKTTTTAMIMHVLQQVKKDFDYLVGARLKGFNEGVKISSAPVIICEADEYPASALEPRPKFHFLFPHVAVITGIAWDHINVFPTFEIYLEQFKIFIKKIEPNGILIYNETDEVLKDLIASCKRKDIRYQPYGLPVYSIKDGKTFLTIDTQFKEIKIFGGHNLLNIHAAYYVCKELGISNEDFLNGISSFSGAAKRLEVLVDQNNTTVFRDFAHAPSKLKATMEAVKQQFPDRQLISVFELHTFSSLNKDFLPQYKDCLDTANKACVFYSKHAMEIKRMPELSVDLVRKEFNRADLEIINNSVDLEKWLLDQNYKNTNLLLMSSGNYDNLNIEEIINKII